MASLSTPSGELATIACCLCGVGIQPNQANMCLSCLKDRVDVAEGISRNEVIWTCASCDRYRGSSGEGRWLLCEPESPELLALCLKSVHGLGKGKGKGKKSGAQFVDAGWIWTEPHSRRLKVRITVEKEVFNQAVVRQNIEVGFVVKSKLCDVCVKETTDQTWTTIVQVRQQVKYKRTLLNLENRLVKDGAANKALNIVPVPSGIDFYFANKTLGQKFSDHVLATVPARRRESKSLQGADLKSNKYNFRHSIAVEVVPICKGDFLVLPLKLQHSLFGGRASFVLCESIKRAVNLVEPFTQQRAKLSEQKYWPNAFRAAATGREMIEFAVLDVQPLDYSADPGQSGLAEVEVARASDLGLNDERFLVRSHIGRFLKPGDAVLGYDFENHNMGGEVLDPLRGQELPDVVLVQKLQTKPPPKQSGKNKKNRKNRKNAKAAVKDQFEEGQVEEGQVGEGEVGEVDQGDEVGEVDEIDEIDEGEIEFDEFEDDDDDDEGDDEVDDAASSAAMGEVEAVAAAAAVDQQEAVSVVADRLEQEAERLEAEAQALEARADELGENADALDATAEELDAVAAAFEARAAALDAKAAALLDDSEG